MNRDKTLKYIGVIDSLRHDPASLQREKERLDQVITEVAERLKSSINEENAASLIWELAIEAIRRVTDTVHDLSKHHVTDFAGHSKHLRALAAAVPFSTLTFEKNPNLNQLFELCDRLWTELEHRQMIETIDASPDEHWKRHMAASMSLLDAFQRDITYQEQAESRIARLFNPFSEEVVKSRIGLTVQEIQNGFEAVRQLVMERRKLSAELMQPLVQKWQDYRTRAANGANDEELQDLIRDDAERTRLHARMMESFRVFEKFLVFESNDLETSLGDKSEKWLEAFSFQPSMVNQSYRTPFDEDILKSRPFARLTSNKYLLADFYYCPFAPLHRLPELFDNATLRKRLNRRRDLVLEQDATTLFGQVCNPELQLRNYYIIQKDTNVLAERDLLIFQNDTALIVECKAKPLRGVAGHRGNIKKIQSDASRSIQAAYDQACSVAKLLASQTEDAEFYDSDKQNRKTLATIASGSVARFLPIVVLDTYYGLIATDTSPWLKVDPAVGYPWVVDRDTLESILWLIDSFDKLIEFIEWRRELNGVWVNEDEAVFAGFYLRHGPAKAPEQPCKVQLDANYADIFEAEYFKRKGVETGYRFPTRTVPPIWSSTSRNENEIEFRIDGELYDTFNLNSGRSLQELNMVREVNQEFLEQLGMVQPETPFVRIHRNDPCHCGSGKKYKQCCLRLRS